MKENNKILKTRNKLKKFGYKKIAIIITIITTTWVFLFMLFIFNVKDNMKMINFYGKDIAQVKYEMSKNYDIHISDSNFNYVATKAVAKNKVYKQSITPGQSISDTMLSSDFIFTVNKSNLKSIIIGNYVNKDIEEVKKMIFPLGIRYKITEKKAKASKNNKIFAQNIKPGSSVTEDQTLNLGVYKHHSSTFKDSKKSKSKHNTRENSSIDKDLIEKLNQNNSELDNVDGIVLTPKLKMFLKQYPNCLRKIYRVSATDECFFSE